MRVGWRFCRSLPHGNRRDIPLFRAGTLTVDPRVRSLGFVPRFPIASVVVVASIGLAGCADFPDRWEIDLPIVAQTPACTATFPRLRTTVLDPVERPQIETDGVVDPRWACAPLEGAVSCARAITDDLKLELTLSPEWSQARAGDCVYTFAR